MPEGEGEAAAPRVPNDDPAAFCSKALVYLKPDVRGEVTDAEVLQVSEDDQPAAKPFAKGLLTCYLVDTGSQFRYVQQRHLRAAGWTLEGLHAHAVDNLAAFAHLKTTLRDYGSFYAVFVDGNFEASLLAVAAFWKSVTERTRAGQEIVAAVPARDILAFSNTGSPEGIMNLRQTIARVYPKGDHLISNRLYRRTGNGWVVFEEPM